MDCVTYPLCLISALDLPVDLIGNEVTIILSQQHKQKFTIEVVYKVQCLESKTHACFLPLLFMTFN